MRPNSGLPLKPCDPYYCRDVQEASWGLLIGPPSASQSVVCLICVKILVTNLDWNNCSGPRDWRVSASSESKLRPPPETPLTSQHYGVEGFKGFAYYYVEERESFGQLKYFKSGVYMENVLSLGVHGKCCP